MTLGLYPTISHHQLLMASGADTHRRIHEPNQFQETRCTLADTPGLKSHKTCLTNHTCFRSHHITSLVINGLGGGHTDRHIHTHTNTGTKAISRNQTCCSKHTPGLKSDAYLITEVKHCHMKHIKRKPKKILIRIIMHVISHGQTEQTVIAYSMSIQPKGLVQSGCS